MSAFSDYLKNTVGKQIVGGLGSAVGNLAAQNAGAGGAAGSVPSGAGAGGAGAVGAAGSVPAGAAGASGYGSPGGYSYDDFLKAYQGSGLYFNDADMRLAQSNPAAGMGLVSAKTSYGNAASDYDRMLANADAERIRSGYGGYTSGADGSGFIPNSPLQLQTNDILSQMYGYGPFEYGNYNNAYSDYQKYLLDSIVLKSPFSYSKERDPQWSSYKKSYLREGDRASSNALAQASAASAGRPSSYAATAASQAGDYYAAKLNDVIPQLYQQAYDRYLNEYQMKLSGLNAVNSQEQMDYQKYLNGRDFAFQNYNNQYNMLGNNLAAVQGQEGTEYSRYLDNINMQLAEQQRQQAAQQQAWENALSASQLYGYTPDAYAGAMQVAPGAQTLGGQQAQQQADQWNKAFAADMWNTAGVLPEQYAAALGLAPGAKTADQLYREQQLASAAARGAGGSGSGSGGGAGGGSGDARVDAIMGKYADGVVTDRADWDYLVGLYGEDDLRGAGWSYRGAGGGSGAGSGSGAAASGGTPIDRQSVLALGMGPIDDSRLEQLVESGQVVGYVSGGKLMFSWAGDVPEAPAYDYSYNAGQLNSGLSRDEYDAAVRARARERSW